MLNQLSITGFKCFKELDVSLRPLTVLIGPNDTGKSAFLSAIQHLSTGNHFELADYWRLNQRADMGIAGKTPRGDVRKKGVERGGGAVVEGFSHFCRQELDPTRLYRPPSTGVPMTGSGFADKDPIMELGESGGNVPAMLDYLLRRDRKRLGEICDSMQRLVPGFEDINITTPDPAQRQVEFVIERGLTIPGSLASVGVRLLLFIVTLVRHPSPPRIVLLEEPENGVHPRRLGDIVRLLREVTEGGHGAEPCQVILTTHSPYLLDHVDLDRDQVLVFSRLDDGGRTAVAVDRDRMATFLDEFMLGEVWFNQSEEGLVAKP